VLDLLRDEMKTTLGLLGCAGLRELDASYVNAHDSAATAWTVAAGGNKTMDETAWEPLPLPPNIYQLDAQAAPAAPTLEGSERVSVAIVGGGIAGLATALHLAEAGVDVMVLESHEPGWGASGNNGGQLNPGLKFDPDVIESTYGPDLGRRMIAFAYDAPNRTLALIRRLGIACEARQNGTLRVAHRRAPLPWSKRQRASASRAACRLGC
jgi:hypothetical protein